MRCADKECRTIKTKTSQVTFMVAQVGLARESLNIQAFIKGAKALCLIFHFWSLSYFAA